MFAKVFVRTVYRQGDGTRIPTGQGNPSRLPWLL